MERYTRYSVSEKMKRFNPIAEDYSFIEATEWHNGEGCDITIDDKSIQLSYSELEAINFMVKQIEYNDNEQ